MQDIKQSFGVTTRVNTSCLLLKSLLNSVPFLYFSIGSLVSSADIFSKCFSFPFFLPFFSPFHPFHPPFSLPLLSPFPSTFSLFLPPFNFSLPLPFISLSHPFISLCPCALPFLSFIQPVLGLIYTGTC